MQRPSRIVSYAKSLRVIDAEEALFLLSCGDLRLVFAWLVGVWRDLCLLESRIRDFVVGLYVMGVDLTERILEMGL